MTFATMKDEFAKYNCSLLGLSVDSNPSHMDWVKTIEQYQWKNMKNVRVTFPIIADDFGIIAQKYGMLMPTASSTRTVRSVFIIDPSATIRAILAYPLTTGRNLNEILRLVLALQATDATKNATPANWTPGEDMILPAPQSVPDAVKRVEGQSPGGYYCLDWYLCLERGSAGSNSMAAPQSKMANAPMMPDNMRESVTSSAANQPNASVLPIMGNLPRPVMMQGAAENKPNTSPQAAPTTPKMMPPANMPNQAKPSASAAGNAPSAKPAQQQPPKSSQSRRAFSSQELARYNGKMGMPPYAAINGIVYDLSPIASMPAHADLKAGSDLTEQFNTCHMGMSYLLSRLPVMGTYARYGAQAPKSAGSARRDTAASSGKGSAVDGLNDFLIPRDYPNKR